LAELPAQLLDLALHDQQRAVVRLQIQQSAKPLENEPSQQYKRARSDTSKDERVEKFHG
jgi:hypothetical protein